MLDNIPVLETSNSISQRESALTHQCSDPTQSAKERLRGIWVPVVTPFIDGILDVKALRQLTQQLFNSGIHGLVACSTTGEFGSLSLTERLTIIEILLEIADEKIPVLVGLNGIETSD